MNNTSAMLSTFEDVFRAEYEEIRKRRTKTNPDAILEIATNPIPTTAHGLTGIALSGGGVRAAAFALGVLQGLESKGVVRRTDYLSTVSGGGYIGTAMTIGMSTNEGLFPFGKTGLDPGDLPETRHLRDNSKYLLQNGLPSAISALAIYLRGIVMNILVLMPILLIVSALLIAWNPDTAHLIFNLDRLQALTGDLPMPLTIIGALSLLILWVAYAIAVSVNPIAPLEKRQRLARVAAAILIVFGAVFVLELHTWLIRLVFEYQGSIKTTAPEPSDRLHAQVFEQLFAFVKTFVIWIGPLIVVVLPYLKNLATSATADAA